MFDTEEEKQQKTRQKIITILVVIVILIGTLAIVEVWPDIKPIPKESACKEIGFKAGTKIDGEIICYNECRDNTFSSCSEVKVLT